MMDVTAGFAEPVLAAQATFRVVMDVMARPGTIQLLAGISAPAPRPVRLRMRKRRQPDRR